jgi:hypothetical protein
MKRIPFKSEFVDKILQGEKVATSRWLKRETFNLNPLNLGSGELVAAVTSKVISLPNGKTRVRPAFLCPSCEGFATLQMLMPELLLWKEFTDADARLCGVSRDWYLKERPDAKPDDIMMIYRFNLVKAGV